MSILDAESPCTKICTLDAATGWCLGCGRTGREIAAWQGLTTQERIALKARLPQRLDELARRDEAAQTSFSRTR